MLIQFSVKNFKTFKDKNTLNLLASNYDKDVREKENIFLDSKFNIRTLKSSVIFGANASGKSKFFEALTFMKMFVISSSKDGQKGDKIDVQPFRLNTQTEAEPTEFEVVFTRNGVMYRYGFEADKEKISSEWLFYRINSKEIELFYRDGDNFDTHSRNFSKGKTVIKEGLVRDNALLLSVGAQFNDKTCIDVVEWFKDLKSISGLNEKGYRSFTLTKTDDPNQKIKILNLLKAADLGIQDIILERVDIANLPKDLPKDLKDRILKEVKDGTAEVLSDILTIHKKYGSKNEVVDTVNFSLDDDESSGTRKFFHLTGPILDVLENGYTLFVDELDSKLHPNLMCKIIALFNSKDTNKNNAQLIFNTHDTNLLSSGLFRRDQIWFTDKNKFGESKLYSLADFKSTDVKKTDSFEENYIRGKYGAVPFLSSFDSLNSVLDHENEK